MTRCKESSRWEGHLAVALAFEIGVYSPEELDGSELRAAVASVALNRDHRSHPIRYLLQIPIPRSLDDIPLPPRLLSQLRTSGWNSGEPAPVTNLLEMSPDDLMKLPEFRIDTLADTLLALYEASALLRPDREGRSLHTPKDTIGSPLPLDAAQEALAELAPSRKVVVVLRLLSSPPRATLEELGRMIGVTRERVRQIESREKDHLEQRLAPYLAWPYGNALVPIREAHAHFGIGPEFDYLAQGDSTPTDDKSLAAACLLRFAGVQLGHGLAGTSEAWEALGTTLEAMKGEPRIRIRAARRRLERHIEDLSPRLFGVLVQGTGLELAADGSLRRRARTKEERVLRAFEEAGKPLTRQQIGEATGLSGAQIRGILGRDSVQWVGNGLFAPRHWGLPEYRGTEEALVSALRTRGGEAEASEVISDAIDRFGCTEGSCLMYLASSKAFERVGDKVRLALEADIPIEPGVPSLQRRVYDDLRGGLVWGIDIDSGVLRGGGRQVPLAVAASLGVSSRTGVKVPSPGGPVSIKWGRQNVHTGSLRRTVDLLGGREGDRLLLRLPLAKEPQFELVRWEKSLDCAHALVGVKPGTATWQELIAHACWQADPSLVIETLWDRSESSVVSALGFALDDPRGHVVDLEKIDQLVERRLSRASICQHVGLGKQALMADAGPGKARLTSIETTLLTRGLASLVELDGQEIENEILVAPGDV